MEAALPDALGRVLAESVLAREPLPPFPASIKDGYAVLAADGVGEFPVVAAVRAGADGGGASLRPGEARAHRLLRDDVIIY